MTGPTPSLSLFFSLPPSHFLSWQETASEVRCRNQNRWSWTRALPEIMQPCTRKNKQWPSLSSVAKAILSWQPGLIFNSVDFLWAPTPKKHMPPYLFPTSVNSTATRLWSCSDHREQRLTLPATSLQTHTMLLKGRWRRRKNKKKQVGDKWRGGGKTIRLT